jgi:hypothetical protein
MRETSGARERVKLPDISGEFNLDPAVDRLSFLGKGRE